MNKDQYNQALRAIAKSKGVTEAEAEQELEEEVRNMPNFSSVEEFLQFSIDITKVFQQLLR